MVNKKKKNRQQGPDEQNASDSTESCDESLSGTGAGKCPHVAKAIELTRVKKALKSCGIARECMDCSKSTEVENAEEKVPETTPGLWLCLRCGHQSCGRDRKQHALKHFRTPRSDSHALVANTELWNVWCYDCDLEIPSASKKKLHECLEFIKRQEDAPIKEKKPVSHNATQGKENAASKTVSNAIVDSTTTSHDGAVSTKNLPRVRGLRNNGNTCFFNAVLQCLAHTPFLLPVLREMSEPGEKFTLPGTKKNEINGDGEEDEEYLPPIQGELSKWGSLTESLAETLAELQSSNADIFNPAGLMRNLSKRCPLFEGGDQHDSQELLRHLLEGVRNEDLKRYQGAILKQLGLSQKSNPNDVDESRRAKTKLYGRQAAELSLRPDQVFRGALVSTLECQDCMHASQRTETFLDLSLPVMVDKPQPPVVMRRKSSEDTMDLFGKPTNQPSKHQLKKEKKNARKGRKRQGSKGRASESGEPTIDEENTAEANASVESEQSDADVEDNLDQDASPGKRVKDGESGYSSEKALTNDDSAIGSPVLNGDSVLASPASPALRQSPIPLPCVEYSLPCGDYSQPSGGHILDLNMAQEVQGSETEEVLFQISDLPERPAISPVNDAELNVGTESRVLQENLAFAIMSSTEKHDIRNPALNEELTRHVESSQLVDRLVTVVPDNDQLDFRSQSSNDLTIPPDEELVISIPTVQMRDTNKESPSSNQCSVSPVSSEVNLEMASPSSICHGDDQTADFDRPISRFAFNDEQVHISPVRCSPADEMLSSAEAWPICHGQLSSINGHFKLEGPVLDLEMELKRLSLSVDGIPETEDLVAEVSEEEVNHLLKELSKEKLEISEEESRPEEVARELTALDGIVFGPLNEESFKSEMYGPQNEDSYNVANGEVIPLGNGDGTSYGPLNEDSCNAFKSEVNGRGDMSPTKDKRNNSLSWSATLSPKCTTDDGECSVMSCLNQFTAVELMTGNNKVGCEACTERQNQGKAGKMVTTNSTKQFLVSSPPPVLILHLKRFQLQRSMLKKMARHVSFPRILDLAPLISTKSKDSSTVSSCQRQVLYSLYGIVEHSGTLQYGHYIAYVKVRAPLSPGDPRWRFLRPGSEVKGDETCDAESPAGKWYCVSDARVNEVSEDKVMRSEAYLLFYERIW